ncbi:acyl-CoA dehydrogenase [Saccharopolyspora sp. 6T]|uniref:acyl-CoA dehydrogenase n=1 Tax=Saccharopolyspora sp. 6T TaxID=2877238 RepID=UPI001CD59066|nr:acyl-CoA dehydrogenase [Saccharopolyspora sp. 6T]MCA1189476.1 acyl-CoA dehydrogenase [Saccharopolyspora sp. 6T]
MPIASTELQRDVRESIRAWADRLDGTGEVRAREEPGTRWEPGRGWAELAELGVFAIAVPERNGGAGGGMADLAAALEPVAEALPPGPIASTCAAGVLLGRGGDLPAVLPELAAGALPVAVAAGPGGLVAEAGPRGGLLVSGVVDPVPSAPDAARLLLAARGPDGRDAWFLLDAARARIEPRRALDFSRSLGRIELSGVEVGAESLLPGMGTAEVRDVLVTLAAAEASGVAGWCLRTAVAHARTREQFGRVIGSFQAVKHLCAEMLCRAEQVAALAWDAARALDEDPGQHPLAAAAAGAIALDAAVDTAKDCVQVLGGIGFTWEHDAHLHLRRAVALRQWLGGGGAWRRRTAELALGGARRELGALDELRAAVRERRAEVRATARELARTPAGEQRARLVDTGYLAPHWPRPHGLDAGPGLQLLIDEELRAAGVVRPDLVIGGWAVPTLLGHGTAEQCARFVRPTALGEITWCQLFSEPGAGSDLAGLRTRAERVPGGWRLHGQKVWTSMAREAHWAICLARTDPDVPKHRGITYFLVDMAAEGIDVRPLREITGESVFNEVFLDGVFVPDEQVVGEPGQGWRLARTTLSGERVAMGGGSALGAEVEALLAVAREADDPGLDRVGARVAEGLSVSLLRSRATLLSLEGRDPGAQASVEKLVGVRHRQQVAETALELLGPEGAAADGAAAGPAREFLLSRCLSIAGGTTQVLRTVAAERILGLPRS